MSLRESLPLDQEPVDPGLPPQTVPKNISVRLDGFAESTFGEECGHALADYVRLISRLINLDRLDGITVAYDYDSALATLDRGFAVFHAKIAANLLSENIEHQKMSRCIVAHECGHVETISDLDTAFPGVLLQSPFSAQNSILQPVSETIWQEYSACRLSARFGNDLQTSMYQESLVPVLRVARDRANSAIRDYRSHGDLDKVIREAGPYIWEPLRIGAYLLGHLDGLGLDIDSAPDAKEALTATGYYDCMFTLRSELRQLWDQKGCWNSPSQFNVLIDVLENTMAAKGMIFRILDGNRFRLDIPFTPETMPT